MCQTLVEAGKAWNLVLLLWLLPYVAVGVSWVGFVGAAMSVSGAGVGGSKANIPLAQGHFLVCKTCQAGWGLELELLLQWLLL